MSKPEKKLSYKRYAIAYMDILGTKEAIESCDAENLLNRFNSVFLIEDVIIKNKLFCENNSPVHVKIFSDNICVAEEIKDEKYEHIQLAWLAERCRDFQRHVYENYGNFLMRGGITIGDLYIDDTFVLGSGLIDAYKLECEKAKYPRIIIDEKYAEKSIEYLKDAHLRINNGKGKCAIVKDEDGVYFLDYLEPDPHGIDDSIEFTLEWIRQDNVTLNRILNNSAKCPKEKIDWLKNYHKKIKNAYGFKEENK